MASSRAELAFLNRECYANQCLLFRLPFVGTERLLVVMLQHFDHVPQAPIAAFANVCNSIVLALVMHCRFCQRARSLSFRAFRPIPCPWSLFPLCRRPTWSKSPETNNNGAVRGIRINPSNCDNIKLIEK